MKKIIKNPLFSLTVGLVFGSIGVVSAYNYLASDIEYTREGKNVSNVEEAINDLYNSIPTEYTGSTTVTPSTSSQTLPTNDKLLKSNITINAIPSTYKELTENTTVEANKLLEGITAYDNDGNLITGNLSISDCVSSSFVVNGSNKQLIEDNFAPSLFMIWKDFSQDGRLNIYNKSVNESQIMAANGRWYNLNSSNYIIENNSLYAGSNFNNNAYIGQTFYYTVCK